MVLIVKPLFPLVPKPGGAEEKVGIMKGKPGSGPRAPAAKGGPAAFVAKVKQPGAQGKAKGKGKRPKLRGNDDVEAFLRVELADTWVRHARGEPVHAVFGIDDVVLDTRGRTMAIARAFDLAQNTRYFDRLDLANVGGTGEETCLNLGLSEKFAKNFNRHWETIYSNADQYAFDQPMERLIELARSAEAAGADVIYVTERPESVRGQTLDQMKRLGVPFNENLVFFRSQEDVTAAEFKRKLLARWIDAGVHVTWFLSANSAEVSYLQQNVAMLTCVLLETSWRCIGEEPLKENTLVLTLTE